jgi:hypothetical protein
MGAVLTVQRMESLRDWLIIARFLPFVNARHRLIGLDFLLINAI